MVDKGWNREADVKIFFVIDYPNKNEYELIKILYKNT